LRKGKRGHGVNLIFASLSTGVRDLPYAQHVAENYVFNFIFSWAIFGLVDRAHAENEDKPPLAIISPVVGKTFAYGQIKSDQLVWMNN
jgi:hypothetical protein